jgi:hypothetical protein
MKACGDVIMQLEPLSKIVSRAFYTPQVRVVRRPLLAWSTTLEEQLKGEFDHDGVSCRGSSVAFCFNQAALVELFRGRMDDAAELCKAQLQWQLSPTRLAEHALPHFSALQPFINLIRLDARRGDAELALGKFHTLEKIRVGIDSEGQFRVPELLTELIRKERTAARLAETAFVIDSLKLLLQHEPPIEVLKFCEQHEAGRLAALSPIFAEARIIALCCLGQYNTAREYLHAEIDRDCALAYVFILRLIEMALVERDLRILQDLVEMAIELSRSSIVNTPDPNALAWLCRLATLLALTGRELDAFAMALSGLEMAKVIDDEPFQIEFLSFLSRSASSCDARSQFAELLRRKLAHTEYFDLKRRFLGSRDSVELHARQQEQSHLFQQFSAWATQNCTL